MHQRLIELDLGLNLLEQLAEAAHRLIEARKIVQDDDNERLGLQLELDASLVHPIIVRSSLGKIAGTLTNLRGAKIALADAMAVYAQFESSGLKLESVSASAPDEADLTFAVVKRDRRFKVNLTLNACHQDLFIYLYDGDAEVDLNLFSYECCIDGDFEQGHRLEKLYDAMLSVKDLDPNAIEKDVWPTLLDKMIAYFKDDRPIKKNKKPPKKSK